MTGGNGLVQLTAKDFKSDQEVRWCPGSGRNDWTAFKIA